MIGRTNSIGSQGLPTQEKTVSLTENTSFEILPDSGFALSKVTANVNVPMPTPDMTKRFKVVFYIGNDVFYETTANAGESVTPPTPPATLDGKTFAYWNVSTSNITDDTYTGAIYNTANRDTHVFFCLNNATLLQPTIRVRCAGNVSINWGDEVQTTPTSTGANDLKIYTKPNAYAVRGRYRAILSADANYKFGNGGGTDNFVSDEYKVFVHKMYLGSNGMVVANEFVGFTGLTEVFTSENTNLGSNAFNGTIIRAYHVSETMKNNNALAIQGFWNCRNLAVFTCNGGTYTSVRAFNGCSALKVADVKSLAGGGAYIQVGNLAFVNAFALEVLRIRNGITSFDSTPTSTYSLRIIKIETTSKVVALPSAWGILPKTCRVYVPDALLNDYKIATNWVAIANQIYPLSEY